MFRLKEFIVVFGSIGSFVAAQFFFDDPLRFVYACFFVLGLLLYDLADGLNRIHRKLDRRLDRLEEKLNGKETAGGA